MMTVKITTKRPDGSTYTFLRECVRVYYTEDWYKKLKNEGYSMQMGEFINEIGSSVNDAWCVSVSLLTKDDESSIILCIPESYIYILQDGKTVDSVRATFIPQHSSQMANGIE